MHIRDSALLAQSAWDATKADEDPAFADCALDHINKCVSAAHVVAEATEREDPNWAAGIAGLEAFEDHVHKAVSEAPAPRGLIEAASSDDASSDSSSDKKASKKK